MGSMIIDRAGNLWFGHPGSFPDGKGGGASRYDGKSLQRFTQKEGLGSLTVYCMLEDKAGNIWFGSADAGACRYDGKTFTDFSATDPPWLPARPGASRKRPNLSYCQRRSCFSWDFPDESRPTRWTASSGDPKTHWNRADDATQGNSGPSHARSRESPSPRLHSTPPFARIRAFGTDYPRPDPHPIDSPRLLSRSTRPGDESQQTDPFQDRREQPPGHRHLGHLERHALERETTFAPILISFSRSVVRLQCFTSRGRASRRRKFPRL